MADETGARRLSPRAREVFLMHRLEGFSHAQIASTLRISVSTVEKHIAGIFGKLGLESSAGANRRVLAVLRYLGASA